MQSLLSAYFEYSAVTLSSVPVQPGLPPYETYGGARPSRAGFGPPPWRRLSPFSGQAVAQISTRESSLARYEVMKPDPPNRPHPRFAGISQDALPRFPEILPAAHHANSREISPNFANSRETALILICLFIPSPSPLNDQPFLLRLLH